MLYQNESLAGPNGYWVGRARSARAEAASDVFARTRRGWAGGLRRILGGLRQLPARWGRWRRRRVAIRELSAMPDALLQDIGVDRGRIPDVVDSHLRHERAVPEAKPACTAPGSMLLSRRPATGLAARC